MHSTAAFVHNTVAMVFVPVYVLVIRCYHCPSNVCRSLSMAAAMSSVKEGVALLLNYIIVCQ